MDNNVLRYANAEGNTRDEMKNNLNRTHLCDYGNTILIWVHQGDLLRANTLQYKYYKEDNVTLPDHKTYARIYLLGYLKHIAPNKTFKEDEQIIKYFTARSGRLYTTLEEVFGEVIAEGTKYAAT